MSQSNDKEQIIAEIRAKSFASSVPGSLTRYVSMRDVERIFAEHDLPPGKRVCFICGAPRKAGSEWCDEHTDIPPGSAGDD